MISWCPVGISLYIAHTTKQIYDQCIHLRRNVMSQVLVNVHYTCMLPTLYMEICHSIRLSVYYWSELENIYQVQAVTQNSTSIQVAMQFQLYINATMQELVSTLSEWNNWHFEDNVSNNLSLKSTALDYYIIYVMYMYIHIYVYIFTCICMCVLVSFSWTSNCYCYKLSHLTYRGRDKMTAMFHTAFSIAFSSMEIYEFRLRSHWNLFRMVHLTIFQLWDR